MNFQNIVSTLLSLLMLLYSCGTTAQTAQRYMLENWKPLPGAAATNVSEQTQDARKRILGSDATDPDTVKLWWFGVSSFIVSAGGHLFLLDAWEPVGVFEDYVPIGREELAAIEPEAIFIGHGHFDHMADAGYVAGRTGALLVGAKEHCDTAKEDAAADGLEDKFDCLILGDANAPAPGTMLEVKIWQDLSAVTAIANKHSAPTPSGAGKPFIHIPTLASYLRNLNFDLSEYLRFFASLPDPKGGVWIYQFRVGDFSLLWYDSAGPITVEQPGGEAIQLALQNLPGCVDVQAGAIVGFNQLFTGLRDPLLYIEHARPKVFLPTHHDAWMPVIGGGAGAYKEELGKRIAELEHPPEIDYLSDPEDYMRPRSYTINEAKWRTAMAGSSCTKPE